MKTRAIVDVVINRKWENENGEDNIENLKSNICMVDQDPKPQKEIGVYVCADAGSIEQSLA